MKQFTLLFTIAIFSIFIGSQITEGILLLPYWQSLSSSEFYSYYKEFGPTIGNFYSVLTIIAALIPIFLAIYSMLTKSSALKFAIISSAFAILFVSFFFLYFKEANDLFYQGTLSEDSLHQELVVWKKWHWARIMIEFASLAFLIITIIKFQNDKSNLSSA